jgi:hypothetical protein
MYFADTFVKASIKRKIIKGSPVNKSDIAASSSDPIFAMVMNEGIQLQKDRIKEA